MIIENAIFIMPCSSYLLFAGRTILKWLRLDALARWAFQKWNAVRFRRAFRISLFVESILERPEISTLKDDIAAG